MSDLKTENRSGLSWHYRTTKELVDALRARKISAIELVEQTIARIEALDQRINSVVVRDFDRARAAAKIADAALARGERRPLLGIPMVVKESFNVAGLPTTWGLPPAANWTPTEDAVAIARVKTAGAIILGKTNVPINLGDWQSYNDIYGTTNKPLGSRPHAGRFLRRVFRSARCRFWVAVARLGHRWFAARTRALLWRLRSQANLWARAASRAYAAGFAAIAV